MNKRVVQSDSESEPQTPITLPTVEVKSVEIDNVITDGRVSTDDDIHAADGVQLTSSSTTGQKNKRKPLPQAVRLNVRNYCKKLWKNDPEFQGIVDLEDYTKAFEAKYNALSKQELAEFKSKAMFGPYPAEWKQDMCRKVADSIQSLVRAGHQFGLESFLLVWNSEGSSLSKDLLQYSTPIMNDIVEQYHVRFGRDNPTFMGSMVHCIDSFVAQEASGVNIRLHRASEGEIAAEPIPDFKQVQNDDVVKYIVEYFDRQWVRKYVPNLNVQFPCTNWSRTIQILGLPIDPSSRSGRTLKIDKQFALRTSQQPGYTAAQLRALEHKCKSGELKFVYNENVDVANKKVQNT